jgi:hypothetical protein
MHRIACDVFFLVPTEDRGNECDSTCMTFLTCDRRVFEAGTPILETVS